MNPPTFNLAAKFIYCRINLSAHLTFSPALQMTWCRSIHDRVDAALLQAGLAISDTPSTANEFKPAPIFSMVVPQASELIGLWACQERRAGLRVLRETLTAEKMLKFSALGFVDAEDMVRIVWPEQSAQPFSEVIAEMKAWISALEAATGTTTAPQPPPLDGPIP